jgi:hypothetical protein
MELICLDLLHPVMDVEATGMKPQRTSVSFETIVAQ